MTHHILGRRFGHLAVTAFVLLGLGLVACQAEETNHLERLRGLGLPHLGGQIEAYYSGGAQARTEKLQATIKDMNAFFLERMGIKADVTLAVLDSPDWTKISSSEPYGLPYVEGNPPVIFMPATSGGTAYQMMMRRREAIAPEMLQTFVESNHTTFEAAANQFVDLIGFHELGHQLSGVYGVDPQVHWLNEFVATYFAYAYVSERKPETKRVFDLLGRPSKTRPKNTSLDDFERLYDQVDDYGWYQGMFEVRVRELYPKMGLKFLEKLRVAFPASTNTSKEPRANGEAASGVSLASVLERVEQIAPGFQTWAQGFRE